MAVTNLIGSSRPVVSVLALVLALASTGCATRTSGHPRSGPSSPPPIAIWPEWRPTDPVAHGVPDAPRGFKVEAANGEAIKMHRKSDAGPVELWGLEESSPVSNHPVLTMVDQELVERWTWIIAVLEADESPMTTPDPLPNRRAVDGLLLVPRRRAAEFETTLIVLLGSLARYNPPEQWLTTALLERGFTVLLSSPPVASPLGPAGGRTSIDPSAMPARAGRTLAREVDVATGIWSVGLEAILDRLDPPETRRFETIVLLGASSGTVALPSVAIRLGSTRRLAGFVFVGGGADAGLILAETSLGSDDLRLERSGGRLTPEDHRRFVEETRRHATRDDREIWNWLDRHPSVILEAGFDRAIPHGARRTLRERMPGAAHWWYPLGHYGLFVLLSSESETIVDWIVETLAERSSGTIPATSIDFRSDRKARA